jgi:hypothetical protein
LLFNFPSTNPSSHFTTPATRTPRPLPRTGQDETRHRSVCAWWRELGGEPQKIRPRTRAFIGNDFVTHRALLRKFNFIA